MLKVLRGNLEKYLQRKIFINVGKGLFGHFGKYLGSCIIIISHTFTKIASLENQTSSCQLTIISGNRQNRTSYY